jgi:hypothetical protein
MHGKGSWKPGKRSGLVGKDSMGLNAMVAKHNELDMSEAWAAIASAADNDTGKTQRNVKVEYEHGKIMIEEKGATKGLMNWKRRAQDKIAKTKLELDEDNGKRSTLLHSNTSRDLGRKLNGEIGHGDMQIASDDEQEDGQKQPLRSFGSLVLDLVADKKAAEKVAAAMSAEETAEAAAERRQRAATEDAADGAATEDAADGATVVEELEVDELEVVDDGERARGVEARQTVDLYAPSAADLAREEESEGSVKWRSQNKRKTVEKAEELQELPGGP